jgi:peroxiredoxin
MRQFFITLCLGVLVCLNVQAQTPAPAPAPDATPAAIGKPAPDFTLQGADGKDHKLSDFPGKFIVLEWTNPMCPFVRKFYEHGAMQKYQKEATDKGVIWLRINSSAAGKEGNQSPSDLLAYEKMNGVSSTLSLIDSDGKVGHLYDARTTPHMFVINDKGILVFAGGIDSKPSTDADDLATAKNYVKAALAETMAGKPVTVATPRPYGCAVKYAD